MLFCPKCHNCGDPSARIEVIVPHELPVEWPSWPVERREIFDKYRVPTSPYLLYDGPGGHNGMIGDAITPERAAAIIAAFTGTPSAAKLQATGIHDGAGWCQLCQNFYCPAHWSISSTGYGHCPSGHGKSLDPHW